MSKATYVRIDISRESLEINVPPYGRPELAASLFAATGCGRSER